jgi:hypothetical protein
MQTNMQVAWSDGTSDESDFTRLLGCHVKIIGLSARTEFNGEVGRVYSFDHQKGRAGVHLKNGKGLWVKQINLILLDESAESAVETAESTETNDAQQMLPPR